MKVSTLLMALFMLFVVVCALVLYQSTNKPKVYITDCSNGEATINFDVDGVDYNGNAMDRATAISMLEDALNDDESYQGVWRCE